MVGGDPREVERGLRPSAKPKPRNAQVVVADTANMSRFELWRYHMKERRRLRKEEIEANKDKPVNKFVGFGLRMVMSLRNISGSYTQNDGTLLPGYKNSANILGFDNGYNRTLGSFVFGKQSYDLFGNNNGFDMASASSSRGWLVQNENLNTQHTISHSTNLSGRASLEPFKDFNIELTLNRSYTQNSSDFYRYNETDQVFEAQSLVQTANLSYSTITFGTAFAKLDDTYGSPIFEQMRVNLKDASDLLGNENANSYKLASGYYEGYSGSQQEVVLGAFIAAYSNKSVSEKTINPVKGGALPNWNVNYNGLTKFKTMKKYFRNFVVRHAYSSSAAVSGIQTNLDATFDTDGNATARDLNNNFIAQDQIQNVTISERFSPLIGIDATWIIKSKGKPQGLLTKFEIKKDRSATLSLNNNQITEVLGNEVVIGTGYKFTDVQLPIRNVKSSDINVRFDMSFRDNLTVIRKVVENTNQATAGQRIVSVKASADYNINQNLTVQFYYDHVINTPKIASSFPTGNLSTGLKIRYNLGGIQ